jgi:hypothetical protein
LDFARFRPVFARFFVALLRFVDFFLWFSTGVRVVARLRATLLAANRVTSIVAISGCGASTAEPQTLIALVLRLVTTSPNVNFLPVRLVQPRIFGF